MTNVVCLLFPNVTQLDLTGPAQVLAKLRDVAGRPAQMHYAWKTTEPVLTDSGFCIVPTARLEDVPPADVLLIPGGQGSFEILEDQEVLEFIQRHARTAQYLTSVCTGSFLLAAAGLLQGRQATTHWASLHLLAELGVEPVRRRVVRDGHVITGAGVTSGIDCALDLVAELAGGGEDGAAAAREIQLAVEYDPDPRFHAGSPAAPEADQHQVSAQIEGVTSLRGPVVAAAAARLNTQPGGHSVGRSAAES